MKIRTLLLGLACTLGLFTRDALLAQPATNAVTVSFVRFENPTNRTTAVFVARNLGGNSIWHYALEDGNPLSGLEVWQQARWITPDRGEICVSEMQVRELKPGAEFTFTVRLPARQQGADFRTGFDFYREPPKSGRVKETAWSDRVANGSVSR